MTEQSDLETPETTPDTDEKKQFQLTALIRSRKYLEWVIGLIKSGLYGTKEDIPKFEKQLDKTDKFISKLDSRR